MDHSSSFEVDALSEEDGLCRTASAFPRGPYEAGSENDETFAMAQLDLTPVPSLTVRRHILDDAPISHDTNAAIAATEAEIDQTRKDELQNQIEKIQDTALDSILRAAPHGEDEDLPTYEARMQSAAEVVTSVGTNQESKKKKKKKKSKSAKKREKNLAADATGFEDFFADVPLRPEEAQLELELYSKEKSPALRLETCVQRYRATRKLDALPWRKAVFDAYLILGGVSTGQKQYCGADHAAPVDPETRKQMAAVDFIEEDDAKEVDFEYLARAFFSYRCVAAAGQSSVARVQEAPDVIINFLKYINRHDVLPEYIDQINGAIAIAEQAKIELSATKHFSLGTPGNVNTALSVLYGGYYSGLYDKDEWETDLSKRGIDKTKAAKILEIHCTGKLEGEYKSQLENILQAAETHSGLHMARESGLPVEVVKVERFNAALSVLVLKPWTDIPGAEEDQVETDLIELKVLLETSVAAHVFEKMHFEADFYQFSESLWFFDTVTRVLPSFYIEILTDDDDD